MTQEHIKTLFLLTETPIIGTRDKIDLFLSVELQTYLLNDFTKECENGILRKFFSWTEQPSPIINIVNHLRTRT